MADLLSTNTRRCVVAALVFLVLSSGVWVLSAEDEAAGQGQTTTAAPAPTTTASPSPASPSPSSPSAASPSALDDFESFLNDASTSPFAEEEEPEGIPGLEAVRLLSGLDELTPGQAWACDGPNAGEGSRYTWTCADPTGSYGVEVVGVDPQTVLSVKAVARGVPDREAEEFLGYVLRLSLEDGTSALDPESWAAGAVPSGGTTFAGDAEVQVYGDGRTRAMAVTSTADFLD